MTVTLAAMNPLSSGPPAPLAALILVTMLTFSATGMLLATRRPGNPIAWFFWSGSAFAFADSLRDEVDLDALRADLLGAVQQTMAPRNMSLWLRERAR